MSNLKNISPIKVILGLSAVVILGTVLMSFRQTRKEQPCGDKAQFHYAQYLDTVPDKTFRSEEFEKGMKELGDAMAKMGVELSKELSKINWQDIGKQIQESLKEVNVEKIMTEVRQALKDVDMEKIRKEVQEELKKVDFKVVNEEIEKAMKELKDVNWNEVEAEIKKGDKNWTDEQKQQFKTEMEKLKPELEQKMKQLKEEMKKMKEELKKASKSGYAGCCGKKEPTGGVDEYSTFGPLAAPII
jgi:uncharacterized phage infection (PIP) family protein YhgE